MKHLRSAFRVVELAVLVGVTLLLATAGAFLGALGESGTDDPLDDPPPSPR